MSSLDAKMKENYPMYFKPEGYVVLDYKHFYGMFGTPMAWTYNGYCVFHYRIDDITKHNGWDYGEKLFDDDFDAALKYANGLKALFPGSFISIYEVLDKDRRKVPKEYRKFLKR
jgi:hypothetical protein